MSHCEKTKQAERRHSKHANTDSNIAGMRMIWMPKTHQSQNNQSSGHKHYFQMISSYSGSTFFFSIFLSIFQQEKKIATEFFHFSFASFVTCFSHSSLVWHWHIKQNGQEELCHLNWGCELQELISSGGNLIL